MRSSASLIIKSLGILSIYPALAGSAQWMVR